MIHRNNEREKLRIFIQHQPKKSMLGKAYAKSKNMESNVKESMVFAAGHLCAMQNAWNTECI